MSMVLLSFLKRYWNYPGKLFPRHCQEINLSAVAACGSIALFLIGRYNPVSFPLLWYLVIISESAAAVMWIVCFHFLLGWGFAEFWDHGEGGNVLRAGWFWWVSCVYQRGVVFLSSCYYFCLFSIISEGNHLAFSSASVSSKRILRHRKTCFRSQRNPVVHLLAAATRCSPCFEELAKHLRTLVSILPWGAWTKGYWGVLLEPCDCLWTVHVCPAEPVPIFAGGEVHSLSCSNGNIFSDVLPSMFDASGKWATELAGHSRAEFFPFSGLP